MIVHDQDDPTWVDHWLEEVEKILSLPEARHKKDCPKAVYKSPPPPLREHEVYLKDMMVVDCSNGLHAERLKPFLEKIEEKARARLSELEARDFVPKRDEYDVFLAHNSIDKPSICNIYDELIKHQIYPWLDVREINPGHFFQRDIQEAIDKCDTAAIFFGQNGLGVWQRDEIDVLHTECKKRQLNLIPVLLPGVTEIPFELKFLRERQFIDFEEGLDIETIMRLASAIHASPPKRY